MRKLIKFLVYSLDEILAGIIFILIIYFLFREYLFTGIILISMGIFVFLLIKYYVVREYIEPPIDKHYRIESKIGVTISELNPVGYVQIAGERWQARSIGDNIIPKNRKVKVVKREGLLLYVKEIE